MRLKMNQAENLDAAPVLDIAEVLMAVHDLPRLERFDNADIAFVAIGGVGLGSDVDDGAGRKNSMGAFDRFGER